MKHTKQLSKSKLLVVNKPALAVPPIPKKKPAFSDRALKRNIRALNGALATLLRLRGVTYEYNETGQAQGCPAGLQMGFVAQDVEQVIPQWVVQDGNGYRKLVINGFEGLAVEALRDLKAENDQLRAELAKLQADVADLARDRELTTV